MSWDQVGRGEVCDNRIPLIPGQLVVIFTVALVSACLLQPPDFKINASRSLSNSLGSKKGRLDVTWPNIPNKAVDPSNARISYTRAPVQ